MTAYPANGLMRDAWLFGFTSQPITVIDQVMWTSNATQAIEAIAAGKNKSALADFLEFSKRQIDSMVELVRTDLQVVQRATLSSLIVLDVHARDVVSRMIAQVIQIRCFVFNFSI